MVPRSKKVFKKVMKKTAGGQIKRKILIEKEQVMFKL